MTFKRLTLMLVAAVFLGVGVYVQKAQAGPPDNSFRKADGRIYCEANPGHPACHASGQLTPNSSGLAGSGNGFAMTAGGGLDVTLSHHFSLRAVQADYFLTRFSNSGNDRQNNFRIGAGIVYRFR